MKILRYRLGFFAIVLFSMFPILLFVFNSTLYHEVTGAPAIHSQRLDLSGYDLTHSREIPLDGDWEFYNDRWIITDPASTPAKADALVYVPSTKNFDSLGNSLANPSGISSYRILLSNCPANTDLFVHIPRLNASYRIFLNGRLVSGKGDMGITHANYQEPERTNTVFHNTTFYNHFNSLRGGDLELVVELASPHIGGLYMTPSLTRYSAFHSRDHQRQLFAACVTGVLIVTILRVATNFITRDKSFSSLSLLIMDVLILFRILFLNEYLSFLKGFIFLRDYLNNMVLQTLTLFLPIVFLSCAQQLLQVPIDKKLVRTIFYYELSFSPFILYSSYHRMPHFLLVLCVASYIPFIFVMHRFYQNIKEGRSDMLLVSSAMLMALSSLIASNLNASGYLILDESLFAPVCFMVSMLLQIWVYMRHNMRMQARAMEASALELKLKDSETKLLLSQIKPHFLYNSLIAIHMLCTTEPELAAETVLKFATFLRTNMNFISSTAPIPFKKELEHIQNYVDIEKLRFQDRIQVVYEIKTTSFNVPPLTIQPLVENAIRHGACKNIQGGTVWLEISQTEQAYLVEIRDDGPGFDAAIWNQTSAQPHGLQNIRLRLTEQMNAQFIIQTAPGEGTAITIILPKEKCDESHFN